MLVKPPPSGPVTGAELLQLNKWELTQLVLRLGKNLEPERIRQQMAIVRAKYRRMGEAARLAERTIGNHQPGSRE